MPNTIHCPQCNRELRVPDELLGKKVKCPACSTTFTASVAGPEVAAQPPPQGETAPAPSQGPRDEYEEYDESYERERRVARAKDRVKGKVLAPAICLLVAAVLGILANAGQIIMSLGPAPQLPPPRPGEPEFFRELQKSSHGPAATAAGAFGVVYCIVIIFASIQMMQMRMWGLSLAGSIMSMINCFNCCCILGLPFGIWAVIVLSNEEVKASFR